MEIITIFLVGISLSMDAFSLSICYGTLQLKKQKIYMLALVVGIYHFIMPEIGMTFGHIIAKYMLINMEYIVFIIFVFLGFDMIISTLKGKKNIIFLNNFGMLLFGFTVSVDSFSAGIGVEFISDRHLLCSGIFSLCSFVFTYLGLNLGTKLNEKLKDLAPLLGGMILIVLGLFYLIN